MEYLLSKGAKANAVDADGKTPLHRAAECGRVDAARLLVKAAPSTRAVADKQVRLLFLLGIGHDKLSVLVLLHAAFPHIVHSSMSLKALLLTWSGSHACKLEMCFH